MHEWEHVLPEDIEKRSFEIITEELAAEGRELPAESRHVYLRVIHATADFGYFDTLTFAHDALHAADSVFAPGGVIVTDTTMALSGINKQALSAKGMEAHCFIADADVREAAAKEGTTRAHAAVEKAFRLYGDRALIFAAGNAPTALKAIAEAMDAGKKPAMVIGVPVGFVNVEQSKELLLRYEVPAIVNRGRKGGSNVAAAICNALLYGRERI